MANSTGGIDISSMSLDDVGSMDIPSSPDAALGMLQGLYKQAEQNAMKREVMSMLHKLIMDSIKKIGQAA